MSQALESKPCTGKDLYELYGKEYKDKDGAFFASQTFNIEDLKELKDIDCLANFYRDFFIEFSCRRGSILRDRYDDSLTNHYIIRYELIPFDKVDEDRDFDELHYSRICGEFERVLVIYAHELCTSSQSRVTIINKGGFPKTRQYIYVEDDNSVTYVESYCNALL